PADKSYDSRVFFDPKTKYVWDLALDRGSGRLYIATGDHGEIFKVEKDGQGSLFFKSDESHIRCLALQPVVRPISTEETTAGNKRKKTNTTAPIAAPPNVIAGTDGSGLIYRITAAGEAFVLYSASKKEITARAVDNVGTIYAAGVGEKRPTGPGPLPLTLPQNPPPAGPGNAPAPQIANIPPVAPVASGAEIYTIAPEGA